MKLDLRVMSAHLCAPNNSKSETSLDMRVRGSNAEEHELGPPSSKAVCLHSRRHAERPSGPTDFGSILYMALIGTASAV
jgi:hypothetical protein